MKNNDERAINRRAHRVDAADRLPAERLEKAKKEALEQELPTTQPEKRPNSFVRRKLFFFFDRKHTSISTAYSC